MSEQHRTFVLFPATIEDILAALDAESTLRRGGEIPLDEVQVDDQTAVIGCSTGLDPALAACPGTLASARPLFIHDINTGSVRSGTTGSWMSLLARVFRTDVSVGLRCQGPMRVLRAVIHLPGEGVAKSIGRGPGSDQVGRPGTRQRIHRAYPTAVTPMGRNGRDDLTPPLR